MGPGVDALAVTPFGRKDRGHSPQVDREQRGGLEGPTPKHALMNVVGLDTREPFESAQLGASTKRGREANVH